MTQTLTTEQVQEIYEAAVHVEATLGDPDAEFDLYCKLEDVGGIGVTIRKLIDMVRAANREAQPVACTKCGGRGSYHDVGACGTVECGCTAPPAPVDSGVNAQSELVAIVERLNASGYEVNGEGIDFTTASDAVGIVLQQLHEAVEALSAPPAPAVTDEKAITPFFDTLALDTARDIMCDVNRRSDFLGGDIQLLARIQCRVDEACRAAMLAQPVSQGGKLPDSCKWTYDERDYKWDSACGEAWMFSDGGPTENGVKFCQSCGKPVLLAAAPEGGNDA